MSRSKNRTFAMKAVRIVAALAAFITTGAIAQPAQPYLVINNTDLKLKCSSRVPNGTWGNWFDMVPAQNWTAASPNPQIEFQCQPPVAQLSYVLKPTVRYSLLQSGAEITLVEITSR